jgi:hypothetical protein
VAVWPTCPSVKIPDISWKFNRGADAVIFGEEVIMCGGDNSLDFYGDSGTSEKTYSNLDMALYVFLKTRWQFL